MLEFLGVGPGISMSFSDDSEVFPPFHLLPGKNLCSWQWRVAASSETSWEIIQSPEKEEENPVRRLARTKSGGRKLYLGRGLLGDNVSKQV